MSGVYIRDRIMAFDGYTISGIVKELRRRAIGGRINKIQQTEADEIDLVIKNGKENNLKLMISVNPSLPLVYLTDSFKPAPMTAPNFCMLLRKHIGSGRVLDIVQPGFDRIIDFVFEHLDEMGDVRHKHLIVELMGRHSNIIFTDESGKILDSIKRVPLDVSSVRQVLPGMQYEAPHAEGKVDPRKITQDCFTTELLGTPGMVAKVISNGLNGIAYVTANEICERAGTDGGTSTSELRDSDKEMLWKAFQEVMSYAAEETGPGAVQENLSDGKTGDGPCIYMEADTPKDYSIVPFKVYSNLTAVECDSVSEMLRSFYQMKNDRVRVNQKTSELKHIVGTAIERTAKKLDLQRNQMKDTEDRDKYKVYGELLNTYGYSLGPDERELKCINYYDGKEIRIPIPEGLDAREASQKYFDKYNKKKRTAAALETQLVESENELEYLKSVQLSLGIATDENDIKEIRRELIDSGFLRGSAAERVKNGAGRAGSGKKGKGKSGSAKNGSKGIKNSEKGKPLHYVSSDGYDIFVGKNNTQNDELTFHMASANDMWFHAKKAPGSHVIVRRNREEELPDATYLEAARLAAYYSSVESDKVEIDYTERKNLKKPPASNPGYVIYHTNYSMMAEKKIDDIREAES